MPKDPNIFDQNPVSKFNAGKIGRTFGLIVLGVVIASMIFRCFYSVDEQSNAVVTQFGRVVRVDTAGFYFKAPWQNVNQVDMTTHGTSIGYIIDGDSQKGSYDVDADDAIMITSDFNLLDIDFYIEYRVSDPIAYVYNAEDPEGVLRNIALANIRTMVSNYTVDEAMTTGKGQLQGDIKEAILSSLSNHEIGLTVVNITIQDSNPPTDTISAAFKAVETAKQGADTAMNQAYQYQNQQIPSAEANADAIIQKANAYKEARIAEAEGQVARFNDMYEEYKKFPTITKKRIFFEKMEEILPDLKVIITDGDTQTMLPLESFMGSDESTDAGSADSYATSTTGEE
ncbi:MAG: FtsH protease activity modulator HflK [Lachnospiraceae bacterium]|nr:FtsH protease activity modulator HflK [Lachnospiraceae bacterium]